MKFENGFEVQAPIDEVWKTILDVERVAPNVPGAQVIERIGDDAYKVGIKVKVGPITMNYKGDLEIVERDDEAHRAVMRVKAKEQRGQGTADADSTMELSASDGHTMAKVTTEVRLSGRAASMSRGIVEDVSRRMVDTFAENLAQSLAETPKTESEPAPPPPPEAPAPPPPPPPKPREDALDVGSLAGDIATDRLREPRTLVIALALAALLGYLVGRARR
jgi:carbon monoxide dehydrogenase subunit G